MQSSKIDKLIMYNRMFNKDKNIPEDIPEVPLSPNLVCVYDITDSSQWIDLIGAYAILYFTSMIVDGVEMDVENGYRFDTTGLHTIEFVLRDGIIRDDMFGGVTHIISVAIPDSVTDIEEGTFGMCSNLKSFYGKFASDHGRCLIIDGTLIKAAIAGITEYTIPDSVTKIGDNAFRGYSSLISVNIPNSVTTIGQWSFMYCNNLTNVYCKATTPPALGYNVFGNNDSGCKIYVPMESVESYKSASGWSNYADAIVGYNF